MKQISPVKFEFIQIGYIYWSKFTNSSKIGRASYLRVQLGQNMANIRMPNLIVNFLKREPKPKQKRRENTVELFRDWH